MLTGGGRQAKYPGDATRVRCCRAFVERHPLKRLGKVEELDGPLLLLASDASRHMNASIITSDAGHSAQLY